MNIGCLSPPWWANQLRSCLILRSWSSFGVISIFSHFFLSLSSFSIWPPSTVGSPRQVPVLSVRDACWKRGSRFYSACWWSSHLSFGVLERDYGLFFDFGLVLISFIPTCARVIEFVTIFIVGFLSDYWWFLIFLLDIVPRLLIILTRTQPSFFLHFWSPLWLFPMFIGDFH